MVALWSSAILQAHLNNKPIIELYNPAPRDVDCVYDHDGQVTTIYRSLGLAKGASNEEDFMRNFFR